MGWKSLAKPLVKLLFFIFVLTFVFQKPAKAQFAGEFGAISGTIRWGTETLTGEHLIDIQNPTTGFKFQIRADDFNTGFVLPPGTYQVTGAIFPSGGPGFVISQQTVTVIAGQTTIVNFDASTVSGLVKGSLTVNGSPAGGRVQFCSPLETEPCRFFADDGPLYFFTGSFSVSLLSGDYLVRVITDAGIDAGIVTITVVSGEIIEDASVQFAVSLGAISGTIRWGTETPDGPHIIDIQGITTPFHTIVRGSDFNTGFILPLGTYTITGAISPNGGPGFIISQQTIEVTGGQTTLVNFDASPVSGLVKGSLTVNGRNAGGRVQFCSPTGPCPINFSASDGPIYYFTGEFSVALTPGDYRVHIVTDVSIDVSIVPISVVAGQILADSSLQFTLNLGAISGIIRWKTETLTGAHLVDIQNPTTGFKLQLRSNDFNTGFILPEGTYEVTGSIFPSGGPGFVIERKTVTVIGNQTTTVDFDASIVSGLVKGTLTVNGLPAGGQVQFCSPIETDPCPTRFSASDGPLYSFVGSFVAPLLPGGYRVHVVTDVGIDMGIVPVTVVGEILDLTTTAVSVPTGQNVTVTVAGVTITFPEVTTAGFMIVTITDNPQGGLPPSAFRFLGTYYELTTTATYTGSVTISIAYNEADVKGKEENLKLFHWDGINWQNITTSVDTVNNIITGVSPTISPFAIGEPIDLEPPVTTIIPSGTLGNNNWYISNVSITLSVTDGDGLGVEKTEYSLDGGAIWATYTVPFTISSEGITVVKARSSDLAGNLESLVELSISIDKTNPTITEFKLSSFVIVNGSSANILVKATDSISGISFVNYLLNDGASGFGTLILDSATGIWWASVSLTVGVYSVKVEAVDVAGHKQTSNSLYLAVYDPTAGFVTGGGWFIPDDSLLIGISSGGKANIGFEIKYQSQSLTPQGNLNFHYQQDSLEFKSTSIEWLVVSGSSADFQGQGMVNGESSYTFRVHIVDGAPDQFEIRIWTSDGTFDNSNFRASNILSKGSIVIH